MQECAEGIRAAFLPKEEKNTWTGVLSFPPPSFPHSFCFDLSCRTTKQKKQKSFPTNVSMILSFSAVFFSSLHLLEFAWQAAVASWPRVILPSLLSSPKILCNYWIGFLPLHVLASNIIPTYHLRKGGKIDSLLSLGPIFRNRTLPPKGFSRQR